MSFTENLRYPNVKSLFDISIHPIEEIKEDCIFVMDTNALLVLYETAPKNLELIKAVYKKVTDENRILIPGQVAREFANNRPTKLKNLEKKLNDFSTKLSEIKNLKFFNIKFEKVPLLEGVTAYNELLQIENELLEKSNELKSLYQEHLNDYNTLLQQYITAFNDLKKTTDKWNYRDPVSLMYAEFFGKDVVHDLDMSSEEVVEVLKRELERRYDYNIPPGYKDRAKGDGGVGDFLIWMTILEIAESRKKNIIFVSHDEKQDWFVRSNGKALYPRFELLHEFKAKAPDNHFQIIRFSEFLDLFGVEEAVVKEVEEQEKIADVEVSAFIDEPLKNESKQINESIDREKRYFDSISEFELLEELKKSETIYPDVNLKTFLYKYLGSIKGYYYPHTVKVIEDLAKQGIIEKYTYYLINQDSPFEDIRLTKKY